METWEALLVEFEDSSFFTETREAVFTEVDKVFGSAPTALFCETTDRSFFTETWDVLEKSFLSETCDVFTVDLSASVTAKVRN